jgi:O-succinylbenzoate synthase
MRALIDFDGSPVFGIPLRDGSGVREGMLLEGPQGWGEFSPPVGCDDAEAGRWFTAAMEGGTVGWPDPRRGRIPIAATVPAVDAVTARAIVVDSGCRTADVAVAAGPDSLAGDVARVEAVRDALGSDGRIRLTANGTWTATDAIADIRVLASAAGELEFVAEPCRAVDDVAAVRRAVDVPIAADVRTAAEVDVAILRSAPLGGVRRALRLAEQCGLPCVVSSAMETSIGVASGLALAGALTELPFACALGTVSLLGGDVVVAQRSLIPVDGYLPVAPMPASPDRELLRRFTIGDPERIVHWRERLESARAPD